MSKASSACDSSLAARSLGVGYGCVALRPLRLADLLARLLDARLSYGQTLPQPSVRQRRGVGGFRHLARPLGHTSKLLGQGQQRVDQGLIQARFSGKRSFDGGAACAKGGDADQAVKERAQVIDSASEEARCQRSY